MLESGLYVCTNVCACNFGKLNSVPQITNPFALYTSEALLAFNGKSLVLQPKKILLKACFLRYHPQKHSLFRFIALIF